MRFKAVVCDVCGMNMTGDVHQYKFKRSERRPIFDEWGEVCATKRAWKKLDMCETCYQDLKSFIVGNNQLRKDGLNPIAATRKIHIGNIKKRATTKKKSTERQSG